eukprot:TRINITY_DN11436_c0_g1_i1.p1 TRINITY_DN11436_c0_g1~~TRINITY_DN11436_c0_g1_i1.p1  ORF type:complete len:955 (-),score=190.19 TRINITY_DN11436_c0_g1_i1:86-2530(-)
MVMAPQAYRRADLAVSERGTGSSGATRGVSADASLRGGGGGDSRREPEQFYLNTPGSSLGLGENLRRPRSGSPSARAPERGAPLPEEVNGAVTAAAASANADGSYTNDGVFRRRSFSFQDDGGSAQTNTYTTGTSASSGLGQARGRAYEESNAPAWPRSNSSPPAPRDQPPPLLRNEEDYSLDVELTSAESAVALDTILTVFQRSGAELSEQFAAKVEEAGRAFREESAQLVGEIKALAEECMGGGTCPSFSAPTVAEEQQVLLGRRSIGEEVVDAQVPPGPRWERRKKRSVKRGSQKSKSMSCMTCVACGGSVGASDTGNWSNGQAVMAKKAVECVPLEENIVAAKEPLILYDAAPEQASIAKCWESSSVDVDAPGADVAREASWKRKKDALPRKGGVQDNTKQKFKDGPRMLMPDVDELVKKAGDERCNTVDPYKDKGCCAWIARSTAFEYASMAVIGINAIWIFIDTDYNNAETLMEADPVFQVAENLFCLFFTAELLIKVCALKKKRDTFVNPWMLFDLFLVTTMVAETWMLPIFLRLSAGSGVDVGNTDYLKSFKLIRLTRAARVVRLLRCVPEFLVLLKALVAGVRAVFFTLVLLVAFAYIFAIILKQLTEDTQSIQEAHFSTVPVGMKNLLVYAAFPDIGDLFTEIASESVLSCIIFLTSVLITSLAMLNMLIGVLCEVVTMVAEVEKEGKNVEYISRQMRDFMENSDVNSDGHLNKEEFLDLLTCPNVINFLTYVQVDVRSLLEYIDVIFDDEAKFDFKEIIKIVRRVKGSNMCSVQDINDLRTWLGKELREMKASLRREAERAKR